MIDYSRIPRSDPGPHTGPDLFPHQQVGLTIILKREDDDQNLSCSLARYAKKNPLCPSVKEDVSTVPQLVISQEERPVQGNGSILADDMGMGKSLTVLAVVEATRKVSSNWARGMSDIVLSDESRRRQRWAHCLNCDTVGIKRKPIKRLSNQSSGRNRKRAKIPDALQSSGVEDEDSVYRDGSDTDDSVDSCSESVDSKSCDGSSSFSTGRSKDRSRATLIVCSQTVLPTWMDTVRKHWKKGPKYFGLPMDGPEDDIDDEPLSVFNHYKSRDEASPDNLAWPDIILTTVVLDEAHTVCNMDTARYKAVDKVRRRHTLVVTRTPIQNHLYDLAAYAQLLREPSGLVSPSRFDEVCNQPITSDAMDWSKIRLFVDIYVLRRSKSQGAWSDLPGKDIELIRLDPTIEQKYAHAEAQTLAFRERVPSQRTIASVAPPEKKIKRPYAASLAGQGKSNEEIDIEGTSSSKLDWIKEFLTNRPEGKIVIFSEWSKAFDEVGQVVRSAGYDCVVLHGKDKYATRISKANDFNNSASKRLVMLATLGVAGEGISLVGASVCIFLNTAWNPSCHLQATDRLHRPGQTKNVKVYYLITNDTMEETVQRRQQVKRGYYSRLFPQEPKFPLDIHLTEWTLDEMMDKAIRDRF
ncbi:hypothetical protein IAR55_003007 [Kwoniella newhampshirensis]|uniref:Helicase C-terminal domain-containing protein n=1 Tax=Kwoniella newhampshirensis TaxID=1651941 RepID=A0AAW0Z0H4_9TREE